MTIGFAAEYVYNMLQGFRVAESGISDLGDHGIRSPAREAMYKPHLPCLRQAGFFMIAVSTMEIQRGIKLESRHF